jgi:leucyl aminopeptidase
LRGIVKGARTADNVPPRVRTVSHITGILPSSATEMSHEPSAPTPSPASLLAPAGEAPRAVAIWLARDAAFLRSAPLSEAQKTWVAMQGFTGARLSHVLLPTPDGRLGGVVLGIGADNADPNERPELALGALAAVLPPGLYRLADALPDPGLAAVAWGLGAYRFQRYKSRAATAERARLVTPDGVDRQDALALIEGVWLGRDLINAPANALGPEELEGEVRHLAQRHGAEVTSVVGDALLANNFPMLHAVGRASTRPPRLLELCWGSPSARRVTLVGKGICFDTGGLDIKPAAGMLLMKKDMGGAASVLALGHMVMARGLDVRLRILIPAAENSIAGNAMRPGDVLRSRAGATVEIGNTDAEGRLVLADALALADAESPELLASFATLTGAARVALGPDLPPFFTDDEPLAAALAGAARTVCDPLWRMPLWRGYEARLDSSVADMNNVSEGPFAGSVIAALFLRRFVKQARRFVHFDIYGWRPGGRPSEPKGGEPQGARALFELLATWPLT